MPVKIANFPGFALKTFMEASQIFNDANFSQINKLYLNQQTENNGEACNEYQKLCAI